MAVKTLPTRFPIRKLQRKDVFKKMHGLPRQAGRGEKGISRRGKRCI